jgi:hypothetical protein
VDRKDLFRMADTLADAVIERQRKRKLPFHRRLATTGSQRRRQNRVTAPAVGDRRRE